MGDCGIAVDSDRHLPSRAYCDDLAADENQNTNWLKGTLLIVVTICGENKVERLQTIANRIRERFGLPNLTIQDVIVCTDET
jgi:hypothetical protein